MNINLKKQRHDMLNGKTVQLQGRSDDLQCLSRWSVGDARAYKYAEDGYYYLKDPVFDEITDDQEILRKADVILRALNNYAKARCDDFQPVDMGGICTFEAGKRKSMHFYTPPAGEIDSGGGLQDAQTALNLKNFEKVLKGQKTSDVVELVLFTAAIIINSYFKNVIVTVAAIICVVIAVLLIKRSR